MTVALCLALPGDAQLTPPVVAAGLQPRAQAPQPPLTVVEAGEPPASVAAYAKFEAAFTVRNTRASRLHWPFDAAPPPGIPAGDGITVDGVFLAPDGREYRQPAFYYQHFDSSVRDGRDWHYPTERFEWRLRFAPNQPGEWKYRIVARDRDGSAATEWRTLRVTPSANPGFVRVSKADSRYFEFDDGSFFSGLGLQIPEFLANPVTEGAPVYRRLGESGINFVRLWISSLYGSAWTPWVGGRNRYNGYLPVTGLVPFTDRESGETSLAMRLDYEAGGDTGWFDACRLQWSNDLYPVKPRTRYRVRVTYQAEGIRGPRTGRARDFGLVMKLGGMFPGCYEPGTSRAVTTYGGNSPRWASIEGVWTSGERNFLPKPHLALENVTAGVAHVRSVSIREIRPDGTDGPEVLPRPSMEHHLHIPQAPSYAFDRILEAAEREGIYLKLVVLEKGDEMYLKMDDNGSFVTARDNQDGFYGTGRSVNRTRWLQQAWWRYLQARWGYSPAIHSWELVNEGDPNSRRHYEMADEFGRFMHFRAFGAEPASSFDHPNDHLVTTSFWHSFPAATFWANASFPHLDYADLHAYVSTSGAPRADKVRMPGDAAFYHTWHSDMVAAAGAGKPVVRGEAGLDQPGRQDETALGLHRDRAGVWLHNFLWSGLHAGGLYELYWWRSHVWNRQADHRATYGRVGRFIGDLDLHKGGYADWGGRVSTPLLRVVGQKNVKTGRMHLWIQNSRHTWQHVADATPIEPVSGSLRVAGFQPGRTYRVEWWDTYAAAPAVDVQAVTADQSGTVTLGVTALARDVAIKLRPQAASRGAR